MVRGTKPAAHGSVGILPLRLDMDVGPGRFSRRSTVLRLSVGYIKCFYFLGCIKLSMWAWRRNRVVGAWLSDRLGVTAAYQRGRAALYGLPRVGNAS
jgi:hypothetical protein